MNIGIVVVRNAEKPDDVGLVLLDLLDELLRRHLHAEVDHLEAGALEHDVDEVLADVVDVALDGAHQELADGLHAGLGEQRAQHLHRAGHRAARRSASPGRRSRRARTGRRPPRATGSARRRAGSAAPCPCPSAWWVRLEHLGCVADQGLVVQPLQDLSVMGCHAAPSLGPCACGGPRGRSCQAACRAGRQRLGLLDEEPPMWSSRSWRRAVGPETPIARHHAVLARPPGRRWRSARSRARRRWWRSACGGSSQLAEQRLAAGDGAVGAALEPAGRQRAARRTRRAPCRATSSAGDVDLVPVAGRRAGRSTRPGRCARRRARGRRRGARSRRCRSPTSSSTGRASRATCGHGSWMAACSANSGPAT